MALNELDELHTAEARTRRIRLAIALAAVATALVATASTALADASRGDAAATAVAGDIVFARQDSRGRASDLYTVNLDGTGFHRLTSTGADFDPAFSPDGSQLAFASRRAARGGSEIYVMNADGTAVRRLTHSRQAGSEQTHNRHPTWAPDGRSIVYASTRIRVGRLTSTSSTDLFQIDVSTQTSTNITNASGTEAWPTYATDGSLFYVRNGAIVRRTGDIEYFVRNGTEPAPAPDNGYLAFVLNGELFLTLGQSARKVADGTSPKWSSDGGRLVFAGRDGLRALTTSGDLVRITRSAARFRHLTPTLRPNTAT
jgi:dipeptidyl aminopeptidase/acylaminoacyl peptidase